MIRGVYAADRAGHPGCWIPTLVLLLFFMLPTTLAAEEGSCTAPLTDADVQEVCDALGLGTGAAVANEAALRERRLAARSAVGLYRTLDGDRECYRLAGAQIKIFAEGKQGVLADRFTSVGDTSDASHVQVLSCQFNRGQGERERFVEVSVLVFWTPTDPDRLTVTAEQQRLRTGESTGVQARLQCGPCPVPQRRVKFSSTPGGTLSPSRSVTDARGVARSLFTLVREQVVTVTAQQGSRKVQTVIEPRWQPWKVRVHARFRGNGEGYQGAADFQGEFAGVLLGHMISQAQALFRSGDLAGYPLGFMQLHPPIATTGTLKGREKHLAGNHWEEISFDREAEAFLLIGLVFHDGKPDREHLYVSLDIRPIPIFTGPAGQAFFWFQEGSCPADKTVVSEALIPLSRLPAGKPFPLESVLRTTGGSCGEWYIGYTFMPQ